MARAGAAIMRIYDGAFAVQHKDDNSPLTLADLESQRIIIEGLKRQSRPTFRFCRKNRPQAPWSERQAWRELWVVDPLDGTREFVKRNGEFTINIALVVEHEPLLGVVAAPGPRTLAYWGAAGTGAFSRHRGGGAIPDTGRAACGPAPRGRQPLAHEPRDGRVSGAAAALMC